MSLTTVKLATLNQELLGLQRRVGAVRTMLHHVESMLAFAPMSDLELDRMVSRLYPEVRSLSESLRRIGPQIPGLSQETHRVGRAGDPSAFGHLGNLRGTTAIVERDLAAVLKELSRVHDRIKVKLNDPLRTQSPVSGPADAVTAIGELLVLIAQWLKRR